MTRVLIVEDEIFAALDLEATLVEAGFQVTGIASDQREAISLGGSADVALVDLNLRDGPTGLTIGVELARRGVQVLFLTANAASVTTAIAGTIGCMEKPCHPASVCAAVDYASTHRNPPRDLRLFQ